MKIEKATINTKRGYLNEDFQFFHLKDQMSMEFEFHHHEFNKIIIFISGNVTYLIEGKAYKLKPWDILLVSSSEIHKPLIDYSKPYERIVIWVNSGFLEKHNSNDCNLLASFELAAAQKFNILRLSSELLINIKLILYQLEDECKSSDFGSHLLKNLLLLQILVYLNRLYLGMEDNKKISDIEYDESIGAILDYINKNISRELSIDNLAGRFYMSRYYLMHKFKKQTGYTIHNYILQKRLIMSNLLIKKGKTLTQACAECGFEDYSSFFRAFKKRFGVSPKNYKKNL
ncbi:MAG: AraC-like DNA-binding protein/mannose-6-phosphate isomerase-like protein (cupin superfamily) [Clostridium sp.]|jgi:AraC-like DNA-binding protein/mannose-6-phosphate isomerase-like protein (cupin superfamily)